MKSFSKKSKQLYENKSTARPKCSLFYSIVFKSCGPWAKMTQCINEIKIQDYNLIDANEKAKKNSIKSSSAPTSSILLILAMYIHDVIIKFSIFYHTCNSKKTVPDSCSKEMYQRNFVYVHTFATILIGIAVFTGW